MRSATHIAASWHRSAADAVLGAWVGAEGVLSAGLSAALDSLTRAGELHAISDPLLAGIACEWACARYLSDDLVALLENLFSRSLPGGRAA